jgi:hypothetical protein
MYPHINTSLPDKRLFPGVNVVTYLKSYVTLYQGNAHKFV